MSMALYLVYQQNGIHCEYTECGRTNGSVLYIETTRITSFDIQMNVVVVVVVAAAVIDALGPNGSIQ